MSPSHLSPLTVTDLTLDAAGTGSLEILFQNLADYFAAIARLDEGRAIVDNRGRFHHLKLQGAAPDLTRDAFPRRVQLGVVARPVPEDVPGGRVMLFGNSFLRSQSWVHAVDFAPPSQAGTEGLLRVYCTTKSDYDELTYFVDEPHGSALSALDGKGQWYVHRIADAGGYPDDFPQIVDVRLEWLRLD